MDVLNERLRQGRSVSKALAERLRGIEAEIRSAESEIARCSQDMDVMHHSALRATRRARHDVVEAGVLDVETSTLQKKTRCALDNAKRLEVETEKIKAITKEEEAVGADLKMLRGNLLSEVNRSKVEVARLKKELAALQHQQQGSSRHLDGMVQTTAGNAYRLKALLKDIEKIERGCLA